jgi:hypothetical protein
MAAAGNAIKLPNTGTRISAVGNRKNVTNVSSNDLQGWQTATQQRRQQQPMD